MRSQRWWLLILLGSAVCSDGAGRLVYSKSKRGDTVTTSSKSAEAVKSYFKLPTAPGPSPDVSVEGLEVYWVTLPARGPDDDRGHGCVVKAGQVLVGADAFRAAQAQLGPRARDAGVLARLASLLL